MAARGQDVQLGCASGAFPLGGELQGIAHVHKIIPRVDDEGGGRRGGELVWHLDGRAACVWNSFIWDTRC